MLQSFTTVGLLLRSRPGLPAPGRIGSLQRSSETSADTRGTRHSISETHHIGGPCSNGLKLSDRLSGSCMSSVLRVPQLHGWPSGRQSMDVIAPIASRLAQSHQAIEGSRKNIALNPNPQAVRNGPLTLLKALARRLWLRA